MNLFEALRIALLDLALHKFRSALATLGIILGVASSKRWFPSAKAHARKPSPASPFSASITSSCVPSSHPDRGGKSKQPAALQAEYGLLRRDLAHLRETFPKIRYAVGLRNTRKRLYAANGQELDVSIVATEPDYLKITRSSIPTAGFSPRSTSKSRPGLRHRLRRSAKNFPIPPPHRRICPHRQRLVSGRRGS